jgi:dTDP-4-dehydrorhamnose 3,5-epimerase
MKIENKSNLVTIEGVKLYPLKVNTDNRGWLSELLREDEKNFLHFGQLYIVNNYKAHIVRGFHMHLEQDEVFFVTHGVIQFIIIDERSDSPTYKVMNKIIIDSSRPHAFWVPRGVQHGSMALTDGAQITAVTTLPYNKENPDEVRLPSNYYGDIWEVGGW